MIVSSCFQLVLFLLAVALVAPLRGQDEPVHMRPEFPLIFPLAQNGKDVTVKYPILISPVTQIKPGMQLRVLYVLSRDAQGNTDLVLAHKGNMDQAYARNAGATSDDVGKMPPEMAHEIEGYRRTVWEVPNNFILAMAQYPTVGMHLIYSPTGKSIDLQDARFSFFDGLFVGLPDGKVTVIAVEKESHAAQAGIKAGDEILSVGGTSTRNDLLAFASAYATAKDAAEANEVSTYPMMIRSQGATDAHQANIPMPPKLKGGLMDGFH